MTSPISQPAPSGRRAFYLCVAFAIIVIVYMVCVIKAPRMSSSPRAGITNEFFMAVYDTYAARNTAIVILMALFAWGLRLVIRAWNDPATRILRYFSFVPLLLILLSACAMLTCSSSRETAAAQEKVPDDVWQALRSQGEMTLYSIDPSAKFDDAGKPIPDDRKKFHGYPIFGSVSLDGRNKTAAVGVLREALSRLQDGSIAMCFDPRHGLRINSGGHVYDFVLCYECQEIAIFRDDNQVAYRTVNGSPSLLNAILTNARIPLAK